MVVLQGQGSAQMERLVYGDSEQLIREYMLRNGARRAAGRRHGHVPSQRTSSFPTQRISN